MDKCFLFRRGSMYEVYIAGNKVGIGQSAYIRSAYAIYKEEG
jgi:hypothetical protein